eukprot:TRINITY_DN7262_c0_g1_i2.p1 TRINITY_DN7262_c0_g1~~TRINITY_DN7262_c0_g1_i2.p1  ORF type:complete len:117 (-),score=26.45 TRINITY_DN7262_c0_g1_i2:68-418(-)
MIRRPPRSTHCISSAASDVYKRQLHDARPRLFISMGGHKSELGLRDKNSAYVSAILSKNGFNRPVLQHGPRTVSYTHLTLPTICSVQISVVAVSLKKKKKKQEWVQVKRKTDVTAH